MEKNHGNALSNEIFKLLAQSLVCPVNNLITNRLDFNKSQKFILMENPFPFTKMEELKEISTLIENLIQIKGVESFSQERLKKYYFELVLPCMY